jgi:hypothetical protein
LEKKEMFQKFSRSGQFGNCEFAAFGKSFIGFLVGHSFGRNSLSGFGELETFSFVFFFLFFSFFFLLVCVFPSMLQPALFFVSNLFIAVLEPLGGEKKRA